MENDTIKKCVMYTCILSVIYLLLMILVKHDIYFALISIPSVIIANIVIYIIKRKLAERVHRSNTLFNFVITLILTYIMLLIVK